VVESFVLEEPGSGCVSCLLIPFMRLLPFLILSLPAIGGAVDFSREIRPILSENCFFCHGPDEKKREAGLRLDDEAAAKADNDGVIAVVPGKPEKSALIQRILSQDPDEVMPPPKQHKVIPSAQVELLKEWIRQGAAWGRHWSYEKVRRPAVPAIAGEAGHGAIDAFLAQRLAREGLKFSPEADAATLVRRLALDLTGLPPAAEEMEALGRASYEAVVDHFLARPAFGEHWASSWLDLARYADSSGYPSDQPREIWAYRDWVIRALNSNMPFDRFTREQLAGDLLPNPTDDQLIATAFHRNTMTQNEGGTSDEEFRNAAVIDRVNTTFAVWMGTTMACAQCHTHKYDPITIQEYFQAYAFLNQTADADKKDESPLHSFETAEIRARRKELQEGIAALESKFASPDAGWLAGQAAWEKGLRQELAWKAVKPISIQSKSKRAARTADDGLVTFSDKADTDQVTVELPVTVPLISALRLETQPSAGFGNFVLTGVKAELVPPAAGVSPRARFARLELPGKRRMLQLAEVQVFSGGGVVSLYKPARQSSNYASAVAGLAVDGNTSGDYAKGSVSHTSGQEDDPWWEVDLKEELAVEKVLVWNRTDGGAAIGRRLDGFRVVLLDAKRQTVWKSTPQTAPEKSAEVKIGGPLTLGFGAALADHEQPGFTADSVLRAKDVRNKGWAVAPQADRPHSLTLLAATPTLVPPGSRLRVTLEQNSEFKSHVLGSFRVLATDDARVQVVTALPRDVLAAVNAGAESRSAEQTMLVTQHYVRSVAKESAAERRRLEELKKQLEGLKPVTVPVMKELAGKERRVTKVQLRGNWQALGEEVTEGTPAAFHKLPKNAPRNRLTLADWLVSRDNPLTARVQVNRLWEMIFGVGIVRTSEEFGSQGDLPFHPELLDWLAAEFMESGWNVKHMIKLMVMSRAYRQASTTPPALAELDPDNRLLARGPRFRPGGEVLRDQALAVSGLLSPKMFGPGVRPAAPNLGLSTAFGRSNDWTTSEGEDRHRRSVYTEVRRNAPYASFTTFDAGNREVCMIRRSRTNTPLQAFVTLNDPVFIETHQAMARRLFREAGDTAGRLRLLFRLCVSREPAAREMETLSRLHDESLAGYRQDAEAAAKMAADPLGQPSRDADIAELAAWTTVANVVMNLDEFLMRR
jgi:hypothetical protein